MIDAAQSAFRDRLEDLVYNDIPRSSRYQRSDIISWLIAEYICVLLETAPDATLEEMRGELNQPWWTARYLSIHLIDEWRTLLSGSPSEIIKVLKADDDHGAHMRQIRPIGNLISEEFRNQLVITARRLDKSRI